VVKTGLPIKTVKLLNTNAHYPLRQLTKIKKWQCPYGCLESARHWNMKVHIRRAHNSAEQPIEKTSVRQVEIPYHPSGNYLKTAGRGENNENPIDFVYDKMRKLNEIRDIANRYNSATPSQRLPIANFSNFPSSNTTERKPDVPFRRKLDPPYSEKRHYITNDATDFNQINKHTPKVSLPCDNRDNYRQPNPPNRFVDSNGYVSEDDPSLNERWFIKYDMHGDVVNAYVLARDPIQAIRDRAKNFKI
jgi:hypothetical protein